MPQLTLPPAAVSSNQREVAYPDLRQYVASPSGISGESWSFAIRSSPRPLRSWIRVAELISITGFVYKLTHAQGRGLLSASPPDASLPPTGLALDAAANLASGQMVRRYLHRGGLVSALPAASPYPRISLDLVREHDGDVELLRKLLQARQEQVEFLMSAGGLPKAYLLALAQLAAARVVLAWLSAIGGRSVAHGTDS